MHRFVPVAIAALLSLLPPHATMPSPAFTAPTAVTQAVQAPAETDTLRTVDRIRLAEAFLLADRVREKVWTGWSDAPQGVLLVTPEREFLIRHPRPSEEFRSIGYDSLLRSEVLVRPRQFPLNLAAAFPAVGGIATVVIGQPEHTGHSSTRWVLTLLHEHFHQLQYSRPDYHRNVAALDLAGGDETGMWMLNFPFPYDSAAVQHEFAVLARALSGALDDTASARLDARVDALRESLARLRGLLDERDHRYFAFQLWQEGVGRYTEYRLARLAAEHHASTPAFRALEDHRSWAHAADEIARGIRDGLRDADLAARRRVNFYPMGAAMALILDRVAPEWKRGYFTHPFQLEGHLDP